MKKMTPKFTWITWILCTATIISIITELIGAAINNDTKDTWTELISTYIPWEASLAIYGALVVWLPFHFYGWYNKKKKAMTNNEEAEKEAEKYLTYLKQNHPDMDFRGYKGKQ